MLQRGEVQRNEETIETQRRQHKSRLDMSENRNNGRDKDKNLAVRLSVVAGKVLRQEARAATTTTAHHHHRCSPPTHCSRGRRRQRRVVAVLVEAEWVRAR
ncbi:hypothetical protein E2C01_091604 [Portunus trituberculatus]|uniref:Uncharacterized protein n=1 Tax=Portunus trituberculatus TaxID=210409 RepID=A0A5B7JTA5_PORTR|nr:hypothetical protein [Portunus trituberculatus]